MIFHGCRPNYMNYVIKEIIVAKTKKNLVRVILDLDLKYLQYIAFNQIIYKVKNLILASSLTICRNSDFSRLPPCHLPQYTYQYFRYLVYV